MASEPETPASAAAESRESRPLAAWQRLMDAAGKPDVQSDMLQVIKTVIAATAAWWISLYLLDSQVPFLAPWVALMTMHVTVYQTVARGIQTAIASVLGVALSFVIGVYLEVNVWTFALAMVIGLLGARVPRLRAEGIGIATTAIFLLASGFDDQQPLLVDRLLEIGVGVAVAILVNLIIIPPLREREAAGVVDDINRRTGSVLENMAEELSSSWDTDKADAWFRETASMSQEVESAWRSVRFAKESRWVNPRYLLQLRRRKEESGETSYVEILQRVDEGVSHLRHLTRTLRDAPDAQGGWGATFRERWVEIVRDAGRAIADPDIEVEPVRDRLTALSVEMGKGRDLPDEDWPLYGSLLASTRHIVVIVDDVASARAARESGRENPQT